MIYFAPNIGSEKEAFSKSVFTTVEKYERVFRVVIHAIRIT